MFGSRPVESAEERAKSSITHAEIARETGPFKRRRKITVKIPQGIENESSLRLRGEGDAGESGTSAGDLYVVCHVLPHKVFTREEGDLHCSVSLDMASAALGTTIQVPTIDGSGAEISIPAGTQNGTTLKLKGKGVPIMGSSNRGKRTSNC